MHVDSLVQESATKNRHIYNSKHSRLEQALSEA